MKIEQTGDEIASIFVMLLFFARRMTLSLTLVYWQEFFWGQVALQYMISTFMIILLQWYNPYEQNSAVNWETFNEYANLSFIIILMCMSDFIPDG